MKKFKKNCCAVCVFSKYKQPCYNVFRKKKIYFLVNYNLTCCYRSFYKKKHLNEKQKKLDILLVAIKCFLENGKLEILSLRIFLYMGNI